MNQWNCLCIALYFLKYTGLTLLDAFLMPFSTAHILTFPDKTAFYSTVLQENNLEACSVTFSD